MPPPWELYPAVLLALFLLAVLTVSGLRRGWSSREFCLWIVVSSAVLFILWKVGAVAFLEAFLISISLPFSFLLLPLLVFSIVWLLKVEREWNTIEFVSYLVVVELVYLALAVLLFVWYLGSVMI